VQRSHNQKKQKPTIVVSLTPLSPDYDTVSQRGRGIPGFPDAHSLANQREIGEMLGVDYSSVSVARKRYRVMADEDRRFLRLPERIESKIKI
jgi:hypothetical protein